MVEWDRGWAGTRDCHACSVKDRESFQKKWTPRAHVFCPVRCVLQTTSPCATGALGVFQLFQCVAGDLKRPRPSFARVMLQAPAPPCAARPRFAPVVSGRVATRKDMREGAQESITRERRHHARLRSQLCVALKDSLALPRLEVRMQLEVNGGKLDLSGATRRRHGYA
eukprot:241976-Chlamydomonas_euryale.AAC.9